MIPPPQGSAPRHFNSPQEFEAERERILRLPLNVTENAQEAQRYANAAVEDEEIDRIYRAAPDISLEDDVLQLLPAYTPQSNALVDWNLKALRRWALRRYAFCLVAKINQRLNRYAPGAPLWLWKDYALPRMGFAMLIGYGVILGGGDLRDWLGALSRSWVYWILLGSCAAAIEGLVHVNVRHQLGRGGATNVRTAIVCAISCAWIWIGVAAIALLSKPVSVALSKSLPVTSHRPAEFQLLQALLCSALAMLLGIVGQFFFTGNKSMAEPL